MLGLKRLLGELRSGRPGRDSRAGSWCGPPMESGGLGERPPTLTLRAWHEAQASRERARPEVGGSGLEWSQGESLRLIPTGSWQEGGLPGAGLDPGAQWKEAERERLSLTHFSVWGSLCCILCRPAARWVRSGSASPGGLSSALREEREAAAWTSEAKAASVTEAAAGSSLRAVEV